MNWLIPCLVTSLMFATPSQVVAAPPVDSVVVFSEIMYNPSSAGEEGEWIEVQNLNGVAIDVSGWRLAGGVDFTFPNNTTIQGGGYLVIAKNPTVAAISGAHGPWVGSLNNSGETLRLRDNNDRLMDEVSYQDKGDWPVAADGSGASLTKRRGTLASYEAGSWTFSPQIGGTPGVVNFPPPPSLVRTTPITQHSTWKYENSGADLGSAWKEGGFNDSTWASGQAAFVKGGAQVYEEPLPSVPLGSWSIHSWTGDADSQIASTKTYTHKIGLARTATYSAINGVVFDSPGLSTTGTNWSITGAPNRFTGNGSTGGANALPAGSGSRQLAEEFWYGASNTNGASRIELSGLTAGTSYITTFYTTGFGGPEGRKMQITSSDTGRFTVVDENTTNSGNGFLAKYWFKAPASGRISFDFLPLGSNATWHHYAFSNEVASTPMPEETEISSGVAIAEFSSELSTPYNRKASMLLDGSGLTNSGTVHGTSADGAMWLSAGLLQTPNDPLPASVTFDLGAVQDITSARIWNYNEAASGLMTRGVNQLEIQTATSLTGPWATHSTVNLRKAFGVTAEIGERVALASSGIRYVRFNALSNHGGDNQFAGLSEVRFYRPGLPPPPVPALIRPAISNVFNSGVAADGSLLTPGLADPHYTLVGTGHTVVAQTNNAAWLGYDGSSQWIGLTSSGNDNVAFGQFTYRTTFDLTGLTLADVALKLFVAVDNSLDLVKVNNVNLAGASGGGFNAYLGPYNIPTANLLQGVNTVDLTWSNAGTATNPGGLRVKWEATTTQAFGKTTLANNPITTYFRQHFTATGGPNSLYTLSLEHVLDDGAIFYLNGQEIHRWNMPAGVVSASTLASSAVTYPKFSGKLSVPASAINPGGDNVLAVELHQATANDADAFFMASLQLVDIPSAQGEITAVQLSEIPAATAIGADQFIELRNSGAHPLSLAGYGLRGSVSGRYSIGAETILSGGFLAIPASALGFFPVDGEKIFLTSPTGDVLDAAVMKNKAQARAEKSDRWEISSGLTAGAANSFASLPKVLINEIMYHHQPIYLPTGKTEVPEEWVELHVADVLSTPDLAGWKLRGGVSFDFPSGASVPPSGYVVIANDPAAVLAKFPGITVFGPWSGSLSNSGDVIQLEHPSGALVDEVRYHDGGRWDGKAAGAGSSLELQHPDYDNSLPESWAASDESGKAAWQTFTYQGTGAPPSGSNDPTQYNEFILGLLGAGECELDDISVKEVNQSNRELIQNGAFSTNLASWRALGNHGSHGQTIRSSAGAMRLLATGATEHMHNHVETTLKAGAAFVAISSASTYNISFKARWISGSPRLNTRLYFNRLAKQHLLTPVMTNGTPGAANTRFSSVARKAGFSNLRHSPLVPIAGVPCTISVTDSMWQTTADEEVQLLWRRDGDTTDSIVTMSPGALSAAGKIYQATIPAQAASTLVHFSVRRALYTSPGGSRVLSGVLGSHPENASATIPEMIRRAYVKWDDGIAKPAGTGHPIRLLMPTIASDFLHLATNVMSNDNIPCTVIYNDSEVHYFASVGTKSSQRGRLGDTRVGFSIDFDPMEPFRGVHRNINLDRSSIGRGTTGAGFGQCEILHWQFMNRAGGVPSMFNDLIYVFAPRSAHTGSAMLTTAEFNDSYLESAYDNGADGPTYKYELIYYPTTTTGTVEGLKIPQPDNVVGVNISSLNTPADKESYRWNFLIGNARGDDNYAPLIAMNQALRQSGTNFITQFGAAVDVDQWLRSSAAMTLCGVVDHYSDGGQHNLKLYARPSDNRILMLPWDHDYMSAAFNAAVVRGSDLTKIVTANPAWERAFWGHIHDLLSRSFNSTYLTPWASHFQGFLTGGQNMTEVVNFLIQRAAWVQSDCTTRYPNVPFAITTNGGADFATTDFRAALSGTAWLNVRSLRLKNSDAPLEVTWSNVLVSGSNKPVQWTINVPVLPGQNSIEIEALDFQGSVIAQDTITITGNGTVEPASGSNLVISQLHYHPADPTTGEISTGFLDADDFEYLELRNISRTAAVNLAGARFVNGITTAAFPTTVLAPGECRVLPRVTAAFQSRHASVVASLLLPAYGTANGNALNNGGEEIALVDAGGNDIRRFNYSDKTPWPTEADGTGPSLMLIAPFANPDHANPLNWRLSGSFDGEPCLDPTVPNIPDPNTDADGDGLSDLLESVVIQAASGAPFLLESTLDGVQISLLRSRQSAALLNLATSAELNSWQTLPWQSVTRTSINAATERLTWTLPLGSQRLFIQAQVKATP